jgi:RNA polymerase sigma-70 factor, ECF subfamily
VRLASPHEPAANGGGPAVVTADFADFYAAAFRPLCLQLYAYTGDLGEAQDVVQEAFCRAFVRWQKLVHYDDPVAWVRRVAWNLATSRWRRLRRFVDFARAHRDEPVPAPDILGMDLRNALAKLPMQQRQAVVLHHVGGMSLAEIAVYTGVAEGTVKSRLHRARATLARLLGHDDEAEEVDNA